MNRAVVLVDDLEDIELDFLIVVLVVQHGPDAQMRRCAIRLGHQCVRGLLNPVVNERVAIGLPIHDALGDSFREGCIDRFARLTAHARENRRRNTGAKAREIHQQAASRIRQAAKLVDHQIHDAVGKTSTRNPIRVAHPFATHLVKREKAFVRQRLQELHGEKRIPASLVEHDLRKLHRGWLIAVHRIAHEAAHVFHAERSQQQVMNANPPRAHRIDYPRQRVRGPDFVVAKRADEQQIADVLAFTQCLEYRDRAGVQPLEIVQKKHQWAPGKGEGAYESRERRDEPCLGILRREFGNLRLRADQLFECGNQIDYQLAVRTQRVLYAPPPCADLRFFLVENLLHERSQALSHRCVRNIPLVLVEFSCSELAARTRHHLMERLDQRRLADSRVAGHQNAFRRAVPGDTVEGRNQRPHVRFPPIQAPGNKQAVVRVGSAQCERLDVRSAPALQGAKPQVVLQASRGLVSVFSGFCEQSLDDGGNGIGHLRRVFLERDRLSRRMAVQPLGARLGQKGESASEHPVDNDP
nr:hypothetical protein [Paraburkholderia heleia]